MKVAVERLDGVRLYFPNTTVRSFRVPSADGCWLFSDLRGDQRKLKFFRPAQSDCLRKQPGDRGIRRLALIAADFSWRSRITLGGREAGPFLRLLRLVAARLSSRRGKRTRERPRGKARQRKPIDPSIDRKLNESSLAAGTYDTGPAALSLCDKSLFLLA